ncbi:MAG: galactose ABC transporter substrate-binding protein [Ruminococcaceae bacterium]|nr:galactose ABC transporter substrate-binding protein [Oscillospiraceae bacterium]
MKRMIGLTAAVCALSMLAGCSGDTASESTIGVAIYKYDDSFMTGVRNQIQKSAVDGEYKVDIVDSENKQTVQNDKVDLFLTKKYPALAINPVDRTAAGTLIDKCKNANTPVVFVNREPLAEDMKKWDKVYYVGAKAEQSGEIQGKMIAAWWEKNKASGGDRNGNGLLDYVMLTGEIGHQDATLRTEYAIKTLTQEGVRVSKLAEQTANWNRNEGQSVLETILNAGTNAKDVDVVFANNDDMALGAIEALKAAGFFGDDKSKYVPVVGVDATGAGKEAIKNGTMYGTAYNDAINQGKAAYELAAILAKGETPGADNFEYQVTDGRYVWIDYKEVTRENVDSLQ